MRTPPFLAALALTTAPAVAADRAADPYAARIARVLKATPLIDGHNDWAEVLAKFEPRRDTLDLRDLTGRPHHFHTDIDRLRKGRVGGQFWSVFVSANQPEVDQVKATLDQIDVVRQFVARYPETFTLARTAADVRRAHAAGRIASMIGVEGGGQIDADLAVLRAYHALGAGYLTLTHAKTIAWADSATDAPVHGGLTPFGRAVVHELNRLGMLVDISHVSEAVMVQAIAASKAPVICSHSSARALADHPRNVPDTVLRQIGANGGVVMVNVFPGFISEPQRRWTIERAGAEARFKADRIGRPDLADADLAGWDRAHPRPDPSLALVADHVEHVARVAGYDHVGIGADFDGIDRTPAGMDDVSAYPALLAELMRRGWSDARIAKLAGENILRAMAAAETVAASMKNEPPGNAVQAAVDTAG